MITGFWHDFRSFSISEGRVWAHSMIVDPIWGYKMSSSLLSECNASRNIARASTSDWMTIDQLASDLHKDIFCRSEGIEMQWNPSTIIALQRFLGRFNKATQTKLIELRRLLSNDSATKEAAGIGVGSEGTKASSSLRLSMDKLSIRLNKENQNRRLLEARVSETNVSFLRNEHGSFQIQGYATVVQIEMPLPEHCCSNRSKPGWFRAFLAAFDGCNSSWAEKIKFRKKNGGTPKTRLPGSFFYQIFFSRRLKFNFKSTPRTRLLRPRWLHIWMRIAEMLRVT